MLLEWWSRTECTLFTDQAAVRLLGKEHAVIILNHNFEIDFLCGWTMCERFGVLGVSDAGPGRVSAPSPPGAGRRGVPRCPRAAACVPAHSPHGPESAERPGGLGALVETRRRHPSPRSTPAATAGGWRPALGKAGAWWPALGTSRPPGLRPGEPRGPATCVLTARLTPAAASTAREPPSAAKPRAAPSPGRPGAAGAVPAPPPRAPRCWPRGSCCACRSSAGPGTSWRSCSAGAAGRRTATRWCGGCSAWPTTPSTCG